MTEHASGVGRTEKHASRTGSAWDYRSRPKQIVRPCRGRRRGKLVTTVTNDVPAVELPDEAPAFEVRSTRQALYQERCLRADPLEREASIREDHPTQEQSCHS